MTQIAWQIASRVFHHQVEVCLLVDVVKKRKRRAKCKHSKCGKRAKQQDQLSLVRCRKSGCRLHRRFPSITESFPYSLIRGTTPASCNRPSTGTRKGESLSSTIAMLPPGSGSRHRIASG